MKYFIIIITLAISLAVGKVIEKNIIMIPDTNASEVNVWDTYVTKKDGGIMHFDIVAPVAITDAETIYNYGRSYLQTKGQSGQPLSAQQCRLCHIEKLRPEWEHEIAERGFFIIEMEGCN